MTFPDSAPQADMRPRRLTCERCGTEFGCSRGGWGSCWCEAESYRLPMPLPPEAGQFRDCLCLSCLREIAERLIEGGSR
jgi:hypothetical protein